MAENESIHALLMMSELLRLLHGLKGEDRSEKARRYAVTITEMEKVFAYFNTFVVRADTDEVGDN